MQKTRKFKTRVRVRVQAQNPGLGLGFGFADKGYFCLIHKVMLSRIWQQLASEQKLTFEIIFFPFGLIKHQSVGSLLEMDTTGVILGGP